MSGLARVMRVECLGQREIRVTFSDELVRELEFASTLTGLRAAIDGDAKFSEVSADSVARTVC